MEKEESPLPSAERPALPLLPEGPPQRVTVWKGTLRPGWRFLCPNPTRKVRSGLDLLTGESHGLRGLAIPRWPEALVTLL